MNKILYLLVIFQFANCKQSADKELRSKRIVENKIINNQKKLGDTIHGDFNNDLITDYMEIINNNSDKIINIFLGSSAGKFDLVKNFSISNDDFSEVENPLQNFFISKGKPGEIIYGASCCANFKTTETYYYKFFKNNWFLFKTSVSNVEGDFIPAISIEINDLSKSIDGKVATNKTEYNIEITKLKRNNLEHLLNYDKKYRTAYKNKTLKFVNTLGFDELAEMTYFIPITEANVNSYNDIAFYNSFTKDGNNSSIFLLKKIIHQFPDRVVAYLNLGDSYWANENKEQAEIVYKKYIEIMKTQNKDLSKIPQRVFERIK
ncbi:hypothetical protein FNJ88_09540 [Chryseobacterium sp. SNU WT5]|uniref:tetratricopeptide repeat protein n=1 Tax=Chryseobacterium sp. SNU WT5 TaxID=2594269 RepID=UPI00117C2F3A|nr:hypothetical protein [Chryseobacterium sp. SNU WT5]QDP85775.1 hypothetical protein FNJ88_09540 [Chryseobacterium sp. SNU WT5]